ncbi:hypothetical protein BT63DRAFT_239633 [Microthyrium microscopicum]|uniref:Prolyl 4-hydroxylase alpha subunit Fe(2+) 2OG dioxygenase domain-containing protein n=1 Tax=Microthyrium microscopicum TaxID=703497 RepID=A0A6A6UGC3_9PEZI|nr:hypothetical protein BT63DRAFT_239633 [Microthyrium microscopicum]
MNAYGNLDQFDFAPFTTDKPWIYKNTLLSILEREEPYGPIATFHRESQYIDPDLYLKGYGRIKLPFDHEQAEAIIKHVRTNIWTDESHVQDEKTLDFELEEQFECRNPNWGRYFNSAVAEVAMKLGVRGGFRRTLPKLVLSTKGSDFDPRQDSGETEDGFGTLVLCLPSRSSGGRVRFLMPGHQEEHSFEPVMSSEEGISTFAWYNDVVHQSDLIESGARLFLTCTLIDDYYSPTAESMLKFNSDLKKHLEGWKGSLTQNKIVSIMHHPYDTASLRLDKLDGPEEIIAQRLHAVCPPNGFYVFLANMDHNSNASRKGDFKGCSDNTASLCNIVTFSGTPVLKRGLLQPTDVIQDWQFNLDNEDPYGEEDFLPNPYAKKKSKSVKAPSKCHHSASVCSLLRFYSIVCLCY